jgi:Fe2+ transport system protein FeoA
VVEPSLRRGEKEEGVSHGERGFENAVARLAEALWALDDGDGIRTDELRMACSHGDPDAALRALVERGLARVEGERVMPTREGRRSVTRAVVPLSRLGSGEWGRVVRIEAPDAARTVRLSSLGLLPGAAIRLEQRRPAAVIQVSETRIALDLDVASRILVRRVE